MERIEYARRSRNLFIHSSIKQLLVPSNLGSRLPPFRGVRENLLPSILFHISFSSSLSSFSSLLFRICSRSRREEFREKLLPASTTAVLQNSVSPAQPGPRGCPVTEDSGPD